MSELKHTYEQKWEEANACAREWMQKLAEDKVDKDYKDCVVSFCEAFTGGSWDNDKKEWDYSGIANKIMVTGHFDKVLNADTPIEKKIQMISGYATYQSFKKDYESITNRLSAAKNDRLQDLDASLKVAKKIAMENCKKSLKELNDVKDRDLLTNTKKALANADKAVAKALNDVKEIPKCLNGFLENIMFGWTTQLPNLAEMTFDADAVVDKIMAVLEKLLALDAVIPPPPGLAQLKDILNILKLLAGNNEAEEKLKLLDPKPTPSIPPDIMDSILGLGKNVSIIIGLLPVVLIKLIFQMLAQIVNMFLQIAGVLGLPSIPFPLTLIPQALAACDDIYDAIMLFPPTIEGVLKRKLEKMLQQIAAMMNGPSSLIDQIRKLNPDIANLASCPKRGTASTSAKVNAIKSQISDVETELKYLKQSASSKEYAEKLKAEIKTKNESLNSIQDPAEFESTGAEITEMEKKLSEYESLSRDSNNDQELIKKLEGKLEKLNADLKAAEEEEKKKQEEKAKQDEKKKAEIEKMKKKYEKEEEERNKVKPCGICGRKDSSNILCPFGSAGK